MRLQTKSKSFRIHCQVLPRKKKKCQTLEILAAKTTNTKRFKKTLGIFKRLLVGFRCLTHNTYSLCASMSLLASVPEVPGSTPNIIFKNSHCGVFIEYSTNPICSRKWHSTYLSCLCGTVLGEEDHNTLVCCFLIDSYGCQSLMEVEERWVATILLVLKKKDCWPKDLFPFDSPCCFNLQLGGKLC